MLCLNCNTDIVSFPCVVSASEGHDQPAQRGNLEPEQASGEGRRPERWPGKHGEGADQGQRRAHEKNRRARPNYRGELLQYSSCEKSVIYTTVVLTPNAVPSCTLSLTRVEVLLKRLLCAIIMSTDATLSERGTITDTKRRLQYHPHDRRSSTAVGLKKYGALSVGLRRKDLYGG